MWQSSASWTTTCRWASTFGGTHRVLGRPADVEQVALAERVDELLVVEGALAQESYDRLLRDAYTSPALPPLRLIPSVAGELVARLQPAYRGRVPILIPDLGGVGAPGMLSKVLLDRSLALLLLLVASPLLLALWLGARLHGLTLLQYTSMVVQARPALCAPVAASLVATRAVCRQDLAPEHLPAALPPDLPADQAAAPDQRAAR